MNPDFSQLVISLILKAIEAALEELLKKKPVADAPAEHREVHEDTVARLNAARDALTT